MTLRSTLNPEDQPGLVDAPTQFPKGPNQFELPCGLCGAVYYVDEVTHRQARSAIAEGGENPFCCERCEGEYEDLSH